MKTRKALVVFSLVLSVLVITFAYSWAWAGATPRPTQSAFQGVLSWAPNPIIAGGTVRFEIEIRNVGDVAFTVTNVQLKTDWLVVYNASDVPQGIGVDDSYKFVYESIPIPPSAVGNHTFRATFRWELPPFCGAGKSASEQILGVLSVQIEPKSAITGSTASVTGALGQANPQVFDWEHPDLFLLGLLVTIVILGVVLLSFELRDRMRKL